MTGKVLIAGVGNIFLTDDAFGVEVVRDLANRDLPEWVQLADYGIRGMHLAHDLANTEYDLTIMVDAVSMHDPPGTVPVIELDPSGPPDAGLLDGRIVAIVDGAEADTAVATLRSHPLGEHAAVVGRIKADPPGLVLLNTMFGGTRICDLLVGDPLPRIC